MASPRRSALSAWDSVRNCTDATCRPAPRDAARCVAKTWQQSRQSPSTINVVNHVCAGQPDNAINDHQHPLSVPRFPWYY